MREQKECTCGAYRRGYAHTKTSGHAVTCPKHAEFTILVNVGKRRGKVAKTKLTVG